jgi:1-acyl-sn-glycerol-3-phosphate acyltransferase
MFYIRTFILLISLTITFITGTIATLFVRIFFGRRDINYYFSKYISWGALKALGFEVVLHNSELLEAEQPAIYLANHQSGIDVVTFGSIYPHRGLVVGKRELHFIPLLGIYLFLSGNIFINRQKRTAAMSSLASAKKEIEDRKMSVWLFPEGTRNKTEDPMLPFKKGAFYLAIEAGLPIIPVVSAPLKNRYSFKKKLINPGKIHMKVLPAIQTRGFDIKNIEKLIADVRNQMLQAYSELSLEMNKE